MLEELFWAILITVTIIVFLFVILPSFFAGCASAASAASAPAAPASAVGPTAHVNQEAAQAAQAVKAAKASATKLNGYFSGVKTCVPEDYPRRPVGACPYAKAQSTDLPLANVPMCVAVGEQNMRLMPMSISA